MLKIAKAADAESSFEYGCSLRRLYPWQGVANPLWGCAIATVAPGQATTLHGHDEEETFIITKGTGRITIGGESGDIVAGDVIYLPRNLEHTIKNTSTDDLEFITIYWGGPEANDRMREMANAQS